MRQQNNVVWNRDITLGVCDALGVYIDFVIFEIKKTKDHK